MGPIVDEQSKAVIGDCRMSVLMFAKVCRSPLMAGQKLLTELTGAGQEMLTPARWSLPLRASSQALLAEHSRFRQIGLILLATSILE